MPLEPCECRQARPAPTFAAAFAPALLDPACATPEDVVGPRGKGAIGRYNVHRNNVTVSLIDALAAIYPAVQRITGVDFFRAMARCHLRATPPTSPLLFEYGRDFPAFIERYQHAQDLPWLADTARIERAWLDAYHAADAPPLAASALAAVPPQRLTELVFTPHPATRIVRSRHAAVTLFAAHRDAAPAATIDAAEPEDALVTRPGLDVVVRRLPAGGAAFVARLAAGTPLGVAAADAQSLCADFDLAPNLAGMIDAGAFMAIDLGVPT
ncbi:MAG: DNA-binding domain-containing protein [Lautropia sp.]